MNRRITQTICIFAVVAFARPLAAQSGDESQTFVVDTMLAQKGKTIFSARGCDACHTIAKGDLAGPDLNGLMERRSLTWIKKWLADPAIMIETDAVAKALYKQYDSLRMPNLKLKDEEMNALLHYIALQSKATQPGGASGK